MSCTRRTVLKSLAASGLIALLNPTVAFSDSPTEKNNPVVLETVPEKDLATLKRFLDPHLGPSYTPVTSGNISIDSWPDILYHLTMKRDEDKKSFTFLPYASGRAFILNQQGFFLSALHVFTDHIRRRKNKDFTSTALLYEPLHGSAFPAKILAYAPQDDLCLGRVDFPQDISRRETFLAPADLPPLNLTYTARYKENEHLNNQLLEEIIESGSFSFPPELYPGITYQQLRRVKKNFITDLGAEIGIAHLLTVKNEEGKSLFSEGRYAFQQKTLPGDSGSPVFDLSGRVQGIVSQQGAVSSYTFGIYVGAERIRELVGGYVRGHGF